MSAAATTTGGPAVSVTMKEKPLTLTDSLENTSARYGEIVGELQNLRNLLAERLSRLLVPAAQQNDAPQQNPAPAPPNTIRNTLADQAEEIQHLVRSVRGLVEQL